MSAIAKSASGSPFDSIRHTDDVGEYWLARELMSLLGYRQWYRFNGAIDRASLSIENTGDDPGNHIAAFANMVKRPQGGGVKELDYRLTRYACYLVAMNGDPRKPEIAAAQTYFAVKTREAEVVIPQQQDEIAAQQAELARLHLELAREQQKLMASAQMLDTTSPGLAALVLGKADAVVERVEVVTEVYIEREDSPPERHRGKSLAQMAKELGMKRGRDVEEMLKSRGREDLISPGKRVVPADYIDADNISEVRGLWRGSERQRLIGEG